MTRNHRGAERIQKATLPRVVSTRRCRLKRDCPGEKTPPEQIAVTLPELETRLRDIYQQRRDKTLYVAGAGGLRYADIVAVIDVAKGAGVTRVGVITEGMRRAAS